ncbi:M23 family metallopeptidase [Pseudoalteromonas fenneropenaei]|uniref:M23 family metallopeptidase n=1 Tax=Pseudoalteromonas fenneropenaei TaxID=1737459 RepID=A0ABV7CFL2_9GAMM
MKWLVLSGFLIASSATQALELRGPLTQGGLITGKVAELEYVALDGKALKFTDKGEFVFGFGRDAKAQAELSWRVKGKTFTRQLEIKPREYKIDKVNGVEQKYVSPPQEVLARIKDDAARVSAARANASDLTYFLQPVYKPAQGRISGVYGSQRVFNGVPKNPHFGLDIANKTGTPVYGPLAGKVVFADPDLYYSGGTVILDHGFGVTSTYIHLSKLYVKEGDTVELGEHFADIGATGRVTGPHLDWRFNWFNERLDPALIMNDRLAVKEAKK